MKTVVVSGDDPRALGEAVKQLRRGRLVAFPTDTVYGLGADLSNPQAIDALYRAKGREAEKAIAVLVGSLDQLARVASEMTPAARRLGERFWPGPLTLVVARHPSLPSNLSPLPTVGIRMPDHPLALALLQACGPLAVTSANLSGGANTGSAGEVLSQLEGKFSLLIDGGVTPGGVPSTVVDCTGPMLKILRQGPISQADLESLAS